MAATSSWGAAEHRRSDVAAARRGGGPGYLAVENRRAEADGDFLSCTATSMIEAIEDIERRLDKPMVNSNQAVLWAALRRLEITEPIEGLGRLFSSDGAANQPGHTSPTAVSARRSVESSR